MRQHSDLQKNKNKNQKMRGHTNGTKLRCKRFSGIPFARIQIPLASGAMGIFRDINIQ